MIKIKKFTKSANIEFISIIDTLLKNVEKVGYKKAFSNNIKKEIRSLVKDTNKVELIENAGEIDEIIFSRRFELGKHLFEALKNCKYSSIIKEERLWNWLGAFYISQLITEKGGLKKSRFVFRYEFHHAKLNLIRTPWILYRLLEKNSEFALCSPVHQHSNMCEQFISRTELTRNPAIGKLCMDLYYDKENGKLKPNSDNHRRTKDKKLLPGTLYPRLYKTIGVLNKTYDIWTIDNENLKNLVGKEFEIWNKNQINQDTKISKKNPTWTRNERIIVLKYYFDSKDPVELSKDKNKCQEISTILKALNKISETSFESDNFRSIEGVRRKILNFCSIDPEVEESGLEHIAKGDAEIFSEFLKKGEDKIKEINTMFEIITRPIKK